jgi:ubiquinone/menaquinone biosynthesis C-methylase UbiE
MFLIPTRRPSRERLDDPNLPPEEMARSLADIALVNRRWGGSHALARHIGARLRSDGASRARILDVGAGSGDVLRRLARELGREGLAVTTVAEDLQWRHLVAGRRMAGERFPAVAADAFRLPFPEDAFDWTISTLVFHHFAPDENVRFLREVARVSRHGFAFLDLRRHLFPLIFLKALGTLVFRTRVSLEDGAASVRQAYTPEEARRIATRAVPGARVEKVFPYRLLISSGEAGP